MIDQNPVMRDAPSLKAVLLHEQDLSETDEI